MLDSVSQKTFGDSSEATQSLQNLLKDCNNRWDCLLDAVNQRRHQLQTALINLGDFQSALDALAQWIRATQGTVDATSVSRGDSKSLEFELARIKVSSTGANLSATVWHVYSFNQPQIFKNVSQMLA